MYRILRHFIILAVLATSCDADTVLYDASGKAAALLDGKGKLWGYDGKLFGTIAPNPNGPAFVYSVDGKQLGWFKSGALHGLDGKAMLAVSQRLMTVADLPPVPGLKQVEPIPSIPAAPSIPPILSSQFSDSSGKGFSGATSPYAQSSSTQVTSEFRPSTAGQEMVGASLSAANGFMALQEHELARQSQAAAHEREMARGYAEIAAGRARLEAKRQELARADLVLKQTEILLNGPKGPVFALATIPELGLNAGDVIRLRNATLDGTIECTVEVFSLDRELAWALGLRAYAPRMSEPRIEALSIIADRILGGDLKKISFEEYDRYRDDFGTSLEKAMNLFGYATNKLIYICRESIPELSAEKDDLLVYKGAGESGLVFSHFKGGSDPKKLEPVPAKIVMRWLDEKKMEPWTPE